jgi:hypothetical protein
VRDSSGRVLHGPSSLLSAALFCGVFRGEEGNDPSYGGDLGVGRIFANEHDISFADPVYAPIDGDVDASSSTGTYDLGLANVVARMDDPADVVWIDEQRARAAAGDDAGEFQLVERVAINDDLTLNGCFASSLLGKHHGKPAKWIAVLIRFSEVGLGEDTLGQFGERIC